MDNMLLYKCINYGWYYNQDYLPNPIHMVLYLLAVHHYTKFVDGQLDIYTGLSILVVDMLYLVMGYNNILYTAVLIVVVVLHPGT